MRTAWLRHIVCLLLPLTFAGCIFDDVPEGAAGGTRTITVNLGITTRATGEGSSIGDGSQPDDMQVWIFDQADNRLGHVRVEKPQFSGSDALGELVTTVRQIVEVDNDVTNLQCFVVLNSANAMGLTLGENSTPSNIKNATFTGMQAPDGEPLADNRVPIYGEATLDVSPRKDSYSLPIDATRAVGKLELLFAKDSPSGYLEITKVELAHVPAEGYLKEGTPSAYTDMATLLDEGVEIDEYLTADEAALGDFSRYEARFHCLELAQPYLLENPYGGTWADSGNRDYVYNEEDKPEGSIADATTRYLMTVHYRTSAGGSEKTQQVYLPKIARNELNKIFARVKSDGYELQLHVLPWKVEEIEVNFEDELSYSSGEWVSETIILRSGNTVQLDPTQEAVLRFTIQTPNSATWHATLTGADMDAFAFVDGYSSGAACQPDENGVLQPVTQEIRIRLTDPNDQERREAVLHVFADIGGVTYELDLTGDEGEVTNPDEVGDDINRFTLLQAQ